MQDLPPNEINWSCISIKDIFFTAYEIFCRQLPWRYQSTWEEWDNVKFQLVYADNYHCFLLSTLLSGRVDYHTFRSWSKCCGSCNCINGRKLCYIVFRAQLHLVFQYQFCTGFAWELKWEMIVVKIVIFKLWPVAVGRWYFFFQKLLFRFFLTFAAVGVLMHYPFSSLWIASCLLLLNFVLAICIALLQVIMVMGNQSHEWYHTFLCFSAALNKSNVQVLQQQNGMGIYGWQALFLLRFKSQVWPYWKDKVPFFVIFFLPNLIWD